MNKAFAFFLAVFWFSFFFAHAADRAVLVHNTLQDIEKCRGKLQLKLISVWGGDEEEDENKFFDTPISIAVDTNQKIYICDWPHHCIKVFNYSGNYLRTIGRKGQGPGDLYAPYIIDFYSEGELLVYERGGLRFQWFSSEGKSKKILKHKGIADWVGITSKKEIAVYDSYKTFTHRKLVTIINCKGKLLKEFGMYHDRAKKYITSEKLQFTIDESDNVYAANAGTPVIRKYSLAGKLLRVILFETPFNIPVEITLNSAGDEIERKEEIDENDGINITHTKRGVSIQQNKESKWPKHGICGAMTKDSKNRIYIVTETRLLTEKEKLATYVSGSMKRGLNRKLVDYNIVERIDVNQLLVFDEKGKIVAQSRMTTFCDDLYIYNNRIFVVDGFLNQRVLEYEMCFEN